MMRLLLILATAFFVGAIAAWLADQPGAVTIQLQDYVVDTSLSAMALAAAFILLLGAALARLWHFLRHSLPLAGANRQRRRERMGYEALNRAMVALSAGDEKAAQKQTRRAIEFLPEQPLTHVIGAETARLTADHDEVKKHYRALADNRDGAFLGLRGLIGVARREGRLDDAATLAEQALKERPNNVWALTTLFDLKLRAADWAGAAKIAQSLTKQKHFDAARGTRFSGILDYCQAVDANLSGDRATAQRLALSANKAAPGFVPAAIMAAQFLRDSGNSKKAEAILKKAWTESPHPGLIWVHDSLSAQETASERLRRRRQMVADKPNHEESRYQLARALLDDGLLAEAEATLKPAITAQSGPRPLRLMAQIAEQRNGRAADQPAAHWLARADNAGGDPAWVCQQCGAHRARWVPLCPSCFSFDRLLWQTGAGASLAALRGPKDEPIALLEDQGLSADRPAHPPDVE